MNHLHRLLDLPPEAPHLLRGGHVITESAAGVRWAVVIPYWWPKNVNRLMGRKWFMQHAEAEKAAKFVWSYGGLTSLPRFTGFVDVRIWRLWGKRQRAHDTDNLYSAVKGLVDCLKPPRKGEEARRLGIIEGDTPRHMSLLVEQAKSENGTAYCVLTVRGQLERKR